MGGAAFSEGERLRGDWECLRFTTQAGEAANTRIIDHSTPFGQCLTSVRFKMLTWLTSFPTRADRNINMWEAHVHL